MRLNLYWRGMDVVDVELHAGSKGFSIDVSVCQPREQEQSQPEEQGTVASHLELADGPKFSSDHESWVFGFGAPRCR